MIELVLSVFGIGVAIVVSIAVVGVLWQCLLWVLEHVWQAW